MSDQFVNSSHAFASAGNIHVPISPSSKSKIGPPNRVTVAIVGAGPAGIGMARVLRDLAVPGVRILERKEIGSSFRKWPATTHFITPSFPSNAFGLTDLNAISFDSSPACTMQREHLSGAEYASYLDVAVEAFGLDVETNVDIKGLDPDGRDLVLQTSRGEIRARFVIWAGGQFQYPNIDSIPGGAENAVHSSLILPWSEYPGEEVTIIGGYESGIDTAIGLATMGKRVTILSRRATWESTNTNPGIALSPLTNQRLNAALQQKKPIDLVGDAEIVQIERLGERVKLWAADGRSWTTNSFPVLATGFNGSTSLIGHWFEKNDRGLSVLTESDESTILSGLFLVGPEVCHQGHPLSFIYEFRQRFAVVGHAIAERMGIDTTPLNAYRARNMFLGEPSREATQKMAC